MSYTIEKNDSKLKKLIAAFRDTGPKARVGILGGKNAREEAGKTNAEIGARHEFGTETLPMRSFLRMPIGNHLHTFLDKAGFDKIDFEKVVKTGKLIPLLKKVAIVGEKTVQFAFASSGFGHWKPSNMKYKATKQTLVETTQLRNSITSDVVE